MLEGKSEVQRAPVLADELLALDRPPRDGTEYPAVLLQRHLQMFVFQPPGAVHHFYAAGLEQRPRVADPERREQRHLAGEVSVDVAEPDAAVNPEPRLEVVGPEQIIGIFGDHLAERRDIRSRHGEAGRLLVPSEPGQVRRTVLEGGKHVEPADTAARAVRHFPVRRDDDGRPVKRVDELGRYDADHTAMPAFAGDDENAVSPHGGIGLDDLPRAGQYRRLFLLPPDIFAIQLPRKVLRFARHRLVCGE